MPHLQLTRRKVETMARYPVSDEVGAALGAVEQEERDPGSPTRTDSARPGRSPRPLRLSTSTHKYANVNTLG